MKVDVQRDSDSYTRCLINAIDGIKDQRCYFES